MRTLDALGISPAPWDYQPNNPQGITVADRNNWTVCCLPKNADARLIAAAPELYEALVEVAEYLGISNECFVGKLGDKIRSALAAASGESEEGVAK